jgi:hypothetical protein
MSPNDAAALVVTLMAIAALIALISMRPPR